MIPAAHLNDKLKRYLPVAGLKPAEVIRALRAPYLTLDMGVRTEYKIEDLKAIQIISDDGMLRVPFDEFRFCVRVSITADGKPGNKHMHVHGWARRGIRHIDMVSCYSAREMMDYKAGSTDDLFVVCTAKPSEKILGNVTCDGRLYRGRDLKDITARFRQTIDEAKGETKPGRLITHEDLAEELGLNPAEQNAANKVDAAMANLPREKKQKILHKLKMQHDQIVEEVSALRAVAGVMHVPMTNSNASIESVAPIRVISPDGEETDGHANPMAMMMTTDWSTLVGLCYEYLAPHNFNVRVTPGNQGKSVEWVQAREHYTLIHRKHPANAKGLQEGSVVKSHSADEHHQRIAHSRRAHTRLLSASRYTYAKGQRVPVRASWCGPKEWKDTAGQTYKILIPV
jgi:hypothetical protein